jgi:hypothetical protein
MWRRLGEAEEVTEVGRGVSVTIPTSAHFQFRCDGGEPLEAVAVTMPPWPGAAEAYPLAGKWEPAVCAEGCVPCLTEETAENACFGPSQAEPNPPSS